MKFLLAILTAAIFSACATTKVYSPRTGKPLLATGGDCEEVTYEGDGCKLHIVKLDHSKTNKIVSDGIQKGIAAGGVAGALLIK